MAAAFWTGVTTQIGLASAAFVAGADGAIALVYDSTGAALTDLGVVVTISAGTAIVLGVFYLVIRLLPSVHL